MLVEAARSELVDRAHEQARTRGRLAVGAIVGVAALAGGEWLADRIRTKRDDPVPEEGPG